MAERSDDKRKRAEERREQGASGKYRGDGSLGGAEPLRSSDERRIGSGNADDDRDLEEMLDRERHGSGEYDPEERYGRRDVSPDRENAGPGDADEPDTAEEEPERGRSARKQDPDQG